MESIHKGFHNQPILSIGGLCNFFCFSGIHSKWLLYQDMFSRFKGSDSPLFMQMIWQRDINCVDLRVF